MSKQCLAFPTRSVWGPNSFHRRVLERRSVERDVEEFCGWETLTRIVEAAERMGVKGVRNAGFIATLFNCGGRVSETLLLKPLMFNFYRGCRPPLIIVRNMPLLKRYRKTREFMEEGKRRYETRRVEASRTVSMRIDEPLIAPMLAWVVEALENRYEWLFPSPYKPYKPLSRKWAYRLIRRVGERLGLRLYPHWFRSQRACQLAAEYEFRESNLLEWFSWEKWETAKRYVKLGPLGLAKKMGVSFRRKRGLKPGELGKLLAGPKKPNYQDN